MEVFFIERAQVLSGRKYAEAYLISMYDKNDSYVFGEIGINSLIAQYIIGLRIKTENSIFSNDNDQKRRMNRNEWVPMGQFYCFSFRNRLRN